MDYPWLRLLALASPDAKDLFDGQPEVSGFRSPSLLPNNPRIVLRHEEIVCPNYYQSEGYNGFFRSMGMHHGLVRPCCVMNKRFSSATMPFSVARR
jgi:hypothetical protein